MLLTLTAKAIEDRALTDAELRFLLELPDDRLPELLQAARTVTDRVFGNRVALCAIVNARSGRCPEDCAFCAQSAGHDTGAPVHPFLGAQAVADAGRRAARLGVRVFSLVISGSGPTAAEFPEMLDAVAALRDAGLAPHASLGLLDDHQLARLRAAGLAMVHHNLETSAGFFPRICTTHAYADDVAAIRAAQACGLPVCSGGLFGMGESWEDRLELALTLRSLGVASVPVNFLTPVPGTPLQHRPLLSQEEALRIVATYRLLLPRAQVRVCGGRERIFGRDRSRLLAAGASGLMVGDFLTTAGTAVEDDLEDLARLGLQPF